MLKVLLVDDEPFIVQGLSVLIDWRAEGYEIVKTAADGVEALEFLKQNEVDLIIADIRMPRMTGLELQETIRKEKISNAYFIILSGYSDFSYARQAMKYSCMEYMLKPVEREELLAVLRKVLKLSVKEKKTEQVNKQMQGAYLARNIISLLLGKYDDYNLKYVNDHMHLSEGVRYVDIQIKSASGLEDMEEMEMRAVQRKLYETCKEFLKEDENHCIFDVSRESNNYDIGFLYCDYMATRFDSDEKTYLQEFLDYLNVVMDDQVIMLVGKKVSDVSKISQSYGTACMLSSLQAFHSKKDIYYYEEEVQVNQGGIVLCKKNLDALISAIEQGDKMQIREGVDSLYDEMAQMKIMGDTMNLNINYLLFQLVHLASEQDNDVDQEEILQYISESSFEEGIMRGGRIHLSKFVCQYSDYLSQLRKNVSRGVLFDVEQEIKEHYAENLTLRELGAKYYVNSAYLGQIFQKKFGVSFKDYLNRYRMDQAAIKLIRTDEKIYQIAQDVGYKNLDYFINKFIAAKGCTPSKYRRQAQGKV